MARLKSKRGIALVMLLATALTSAAGAGVLANRVEEALPPPELTVHEWGTFTTFAGSDGKLLRFQPDNDDLPAFVHRSPRAGKFPSPSSSFTGPTLVSMETPVLYFYSDRELTVAVDVVFPHGKITEWYPRQTPGNPVSWLRYDNLRIIPGGTHPLPTDQPPDVTATQTIPPIAPPPPSHYYAARETDADRVQVEWNEPLPTATPSWLGVVRDKLGWKERPVRHVETEKFIFYRGTADMDIPLRVAALDRDRVRIQSTGRRIAAAVLLHVENGELSFQEIGGIEPEGAVLELPNEPAGRPALVEVLVRQLTGAGLYEKEARAMVKTWESAWLAEDGTRLLYLVPQRYTDEVLPLRVSPQPKAVVRVLVGRHDFLTREREASIDHHARALLSEQLSEAARAEISANFNKFGRFAAPALAAAHRRLRSTP